MLVDLEILSAALAAKKRGRTGDGTALTELHGRIQRETSGK